MKKKFFLTFVIMITTIVLMVSLGFNIFFLATKPKTASSIFNVCKFSIVELKAESENVGISYGTAVIISDDGTMITNAHNITYSQLGQSYNFDKLSIRFVDEENYRSAIIIKFDLNLDLAVIKLDVVDRKIQPIKIGDSTNLSSGDEIFAIGNLSNNGLSISKGIVSIPSINVNYNNFTRNVIQCDLTISDGNSGGALINQKEQLIGITSFRLKDHSNNIIYGISYCIPINTVMEYIEND